MTSLTNETINLRVRWSIWATKCYKITITKSDPNWVQCASLSYKNSANRYETSF